MESNTKPVIAVTMGDPAGIGPEIIVKALVRPEISAVCRPVVLGDRSAMERAVQLVGADFRIEVIDTPSTCTPATEGICLKPLTDLALCDMEYGKPTAAGGDAVFRYITEAARLCLSGHVDAMATAPINKEAMNAAGHHYPGHTELLAELTGTKDFVMMLAGSKLRVSLVTIHEALAEVPRLVTFDKVLATIRTTHRDMVRYFMPRPRLAVLALNPHCGEGGMFGKEDEQIIRPAVEAAREEGIDAIGPLSADTLFHLAIKGDYDAVVCMYHDQGLIPLKLLHFDDGVNVTLGLPIIRTSVDHGTAYNLAGKGVASADSMVAAITMAAGMAVVRRAGKA
ncbi:4-hydroxythreonine-4-phosphate dehydrogenase PdxA [Geotalea sp. SG265]|uniref:4-hydroxythreonine-4-phosphate dehydrogenase PdxA n=1 Tax=Geotalea sp. SG265 TaxID=2922867 RepID=UPI001FAFD416|nr:4-hydroxythreonine-4-phosphate dehydrogenase PdxA [Geotalea sp. SG265]